MEFAVEKFAGVDRVLSHEAIEFVTMLHREFNPHREELLARRDRVKYELDSGKLPDFLSDTKKIRESEWKVAPIPRDLLDRRVGITGRVDRKMIINALNSGANVFMADFEDSSAPTWANNVEGQQLYHAVRDQEMKSVGDRPHAKTASALFDRLTASDELEDFLTIPAYEELLKVEQGVKS